MRGQHLEKVDERKQAEEPAGAKAVAQALSLLEFGRCAASAIDERPVRSGCPDDVSPDSGENRGPRVRGERAYLASLLDERATAEGNRDEWIRQELNRPAVVAGLPRVGETEELGRHREWGRVDAERHHCLGIRPSPRTG